MKSGIDRDYPSFSSSSKYRKVKYEDEVRPGSFSSIHNNGNNGGGGGGTSRNGHNKYGDYNTPYKIPRKSQSLFSIILKIVTVVLVLVAAAICYLSQMNSQDQQRMIQKIKSRASAVKVRGTSFMREYFSKYSSSHMQINQVEMGIHLFKSNDPVGAESICKLATERDPSNMKAWVCLGEARLSLHNSAWSSGLMEYQSRFVFDKLLEARENFEVALSMNRGPTCPEARLGLGLSLFLLATRRVDTKRYYLKKESTSQLLFDSILHFNAAASLTSPSALVGERENVADDKRKIHMAATYNSAMAHLALGDTSTAAPLLEEVITALEDEKQEIVNGGDSLVVPKVNLVGTLVQRGAWKKAAAMMDTRYCINIEPQEQHDKFAKLCTIILNNAGIIQEEVEEDEEEEEGGGAEANGDEVESNYRKAVEFERNLLIQDGFSSRNYEASGRIHRRGDKNGARAHVRLDRLEDIIVDENKNKGRFVNKEGLSRATTHVLSSQSFYDAISALEESAMKNPTQSRLWLSLSKAKLRSGDRIGAVEAGTNALNSAKSAEELEAANELLDAALSQHNLVADAVSSSIAILQEEEGYPTDERSYVEALRLEREILILKLQILQESLHERDGVHVDTSAVSADVPSVKDSSYTSQTSSREESSSGSGLVAPLTRVESILEVDVRYETVQMPTKDAPSMEESTDTTPDSNTSPLIGNDEESEEKSEAPASEMFAKVQIEDEVNQHESKVADTDNHAEPLNVEAIYIDNEDATRQVESDLGIVDEQQAIIGAPGNHDGEEYLSVVEDDLRHDEEPQNNQTNNYEVGKTEDLVSGDMESGMRPYRVDEWIEVPNLYQAEDLRDEQVSTSALSYMKMADAYLQKQNFKAASKQFLKVLKKFPFHIPALLGYATSLERIANSRQLVDVVMAYTNVTQSALALGNENLADASLKRATSVSRNIQENRVDILREIARLSFTYELAAVAQFELGMELLSNSSADSQAELDAVSAFLASNEYARRNTEDGQGVHGKSLVQLGKLALDRENNPKKALLFLDQASSQDLGDFVVECWVYSARSKYSLGDREGAMVFLERAIAPESPRSDATPHAYHLLAVIMKELGEDSVQVERNMEMALNLGLDVTPEALEVLGEHNIAVIKSVHRAEWKRYQQSAKDAQQRQGGIMSGASVSSTANSIFTPRGATDTDKDGSSSEEDALALLEQGAASYDGSSIPSGDEVEGDSVLSVNVNHQSRAKVNSR